MGVSLGADGCAAWRIKTSQKYCHSHKLPHRYFIRKVEKLNEAAHRSGWQPPSLRGQKAEFFFDPKRQTQRFGGILSILGKN